MKNISKGPKGLLRGVLSDKQQTPNHNTKLNNNKHRPENKDDIDSREGEEQLTKGDDTTHNRKERKNLKKSTGK